MKREKGDFKEAVGLSCFKNSVADKQCHFFFTSQKQLPSHLDLLYTQPPPTIYLHVSAEKANRAIRRYLYLYLVIFIGI